MAHSDRQILDLTV